MKEFLEIIKHLKGFLKKKKDPEEIKEDFQEFLEDLKEEEAITPIEEDLFLQILDLKTLELGDFLIPRPDIIWMDKNDPWPAVKEKIAEYPHHYYPVCQKVPDNYLGYVSLKDLVKGINLKNFHWSLYVKKSLVLPRELPIISALEKIKVTSAQLIFVIDENSEFIGIVLLKDIFEEIFYFNQICPTKDEKGYFVVSGKTKIRLLERCLNLTFPEGNYTTLAGFIMDQFKGIPPKNTRLTLPGLEIEIMDADERTIKLVKIKTQS